MTTSSNTSLYNYSPSTESPSIQVINNFVNQIVFQVEEYIRNGFTILGIIGINRSPSCGINTTSKNNQEVGGEGVFVEILRKALEEKGISIDMVGIKALETEKALIDIKKLLNIK